MTRLEDISVANVALLEVLFREGLLQITIQFA